MDGMPSQLALCGSETPSLERKPYHREQRPDTAMDAPEVLIHDPHGQAEGWRNLTWQADALCGVCCFLQIDSVEHFLQGIDVIDLEAVLASHTAQEVGLHQADMQLQRASSWHM